MRRQIDAAVDVVSAVAATGVWRQVDATVDVVSAVAATGMRRQVDTTVDVVSALGDDNIHAAVGVIRPTGMDGATEGQRGYEEQRREREKMALCHEVTSMSRARIPSTRGWPR